MLLYYLAYLLFNLPMDGELNLIYAINGIGLVLLIGFILFTYKSGRVPKQKQNLWVAVLVLGNLLAFLFYWYFYMWKTDGKN